MPWRMRWDLPKGKVSTETHLCKGVEVRTGFHEFTDSCAGSLECWVEVMIKQLLKRPGGPG